MSARGTAEDAFAPTNKTAISFAVNLSGRTQESCEVERAVRNFLFGGKSQGHVAILVFPRFTHFW